MKRYTITLSVTMLMHENEDVGYTARAIGERVRISLENEGGNREAQVRVLGPLEAGTDGK